MVEPSIFREASNDVGAIEVWASWTTEASFPRRWRRPWALTYIQIWTLASAVVTSLYATPTFIQYARRQVNTLPPSKHFKLCPPTPHHEHIPHKAL
jgi:hypothetical protein